MEISEEVKTQEITEPGQEVEVKEEVTPETTPVVPVEEVTEAPLSVEDIVSGKKTPKGVQKRIDELTREKYEARRKAEYWENEAKKITQPPYVAAQPPSNRPMPPVEAEFADMEQFRQARVAYEDKLDVWKTEQNRSSTLMAEQEREFTENIAKFNANAEKMRAKYPDFDDTVNQEYFTIPLANEIHSSDFGPEIGYFLAKNPVEAQRIGKLKPNMIAKEIGKLEVRFSEALTRKTSNAPPPITPITGNDVPGKDPSKMTDAEWNEWYRAERSKKFQTKK